MNHVSRFSSASQSKRSPGQIKVLKLEGSTRVLKAGSTVLSPARAALKFASMSETLTSAMPPTHSRSENPPGSGNSVAPEVTKELTEPSKGPHARLFSDIPTRGLLSLSRGSDPSSASSKSENPSPSSSSSRLSPTPSPSVSTDSAGSFGNPSRASLTPSPSLSTSECLNASSGKSSSASQYPSLSLSLLEGQDVTPSIGNHFLERKSPLLPNSQKPVLEET